jgi:hypothetical protein
MFEEPLYFPTFLASLRHVPLVSSFFTKSWM